MSEEENELVDVDLEDDLEIDDVPEDVEDLEVDTLVPDFEGDEPVVEDVFDDDDDEVEPSRPKARKVDDDDDDDEEEEEDVEADLDEILRGRMATDDEEDDDDDDAALVNEGAKPGTVNTRKSDEFVCGICFMVVAQKQSDLPCPMGDGLESHQPLDL